jgi:holo-[acyl-carrier-protein] synthase
MQNLPSFIVGIGTDIVQVPRIEKLYAKFGEKFLNKNYHELEIKDFWKLNKEKQCLYLAKRFAAKEAISKAFGFGIIVDICCMPHLRLIIILCVIFLIQILIVNKSTTRVPSIEIYLRVELCDFET